MLHILCISDGHKQFSTAVEEYIKRLPKIVNLVCLKPSRKDDPISVIKEETVILQEKLTKLPKPWILLEKSGKTFTSEQFAALLTKHDQIGTFIIGGPYGVDVNVIKADLVLSFGAQTMPHGLALTVLLEQLRRAKCITEGKTYHY